MNIAQHVLNVLAEDQSKTAIIEAGGNLITRGQLRNKILRRAKCLTDAGLVPGNRVIVQSSPGIELSTSALAILVAGGVLVLAEAGMAPEIYKKRVARAGVVWFVVDRRIHWIHSIPGFGKFLRQRGVPLPPPVDSSKVRRLVTPLPGEASVEPAHEVVERTDQSDAVIVFTGGTTQDPKGVRFSHRSLDAFISAIGVLTAPYAITNFVADTPQQILYGLYMGVGVWVPNGRGDKRASGIAQCLARGDVEMYFGPPSTWIRILALAQRDGILISNKLRLVMLGGAPVSNKLLDQLERWLPADTEVRVLYGLTEVGPVCSCTSAYRRHWQGEDNLVGVALPNIQMTIANPGQDGVGELQIRGPSVFSGYVGHEASGGVLKTGDLARLVEYEGETNLVLMGRKKDMIIRQGVNIYPSVVESIIQQVCDRLGQPLLIDCQLVGIWDPSKEDEHVVLFYVPNPDTPVNPSLLRQRLLGYVSTDLLPDTIFEIAKIPTVGRQHKADKRKLRHLAANALGMSSELPSLTNVKS
jgi:acyl-CoA synthetase (AMP-forming)/AMP-acid ligase II